MDRRGGSAVVWFDYTTTPPTLKVGTRDQLDTVTLPLIGGAPQSAATESIKIQRRDDLVPSAIAFKVPDQRADQWRLLTRWWSTMWQRRWMGA